MSGIGEADVAALRDDLEKLVAELETMVEATRSGSRPVDLDEPIGRVSRMDAIQQQSMTQANRTAAMRRLAQARAALQRIGADEYVTCQACGEDVALARLQAAPETPFCVECQGRREASR